MNQFFLGIDVGATKTHALVADQHGQICGFGKAGPGNHETVGYAAMAEALRQSSAMALAGAGITAEQLAGAGLGIGGYDWPSQREQMLSTIHAAGIRAPLEFVNDAVLGLLAGTAQGWGVALVAGTSNNCRGRDQRGREGRVTGEGVRFGEYGGASELIQHAIQAVSRAWSRRGPPTQIADLFLDAVGARSVYELLEGLALGWYDLDAGLAPQIFALARDGDGVAQEIVLWTAQSLGDLAGGVIRQLGIQDLGVEVVLLGSLFNAGEQLIGPLRAAICAVAPAAQLVRLSAPPVVGAVLLGMQHAGLAGADARTQLLQSWPAYRPPDA